MRYINFFWVFVLLFSLNGCVNLDCKSDLTVALKNTDTAVVALYIDDKGFPQPTVDRVDVHPGQKIVFVGPDTFDIFFKDQRSPIDKLEVQASNGVVVIEIPSDIFEREQRKYAVTGENKELVYRYGIRSNGKVTDPEIGIRPR